MNNHRHILKLRLSLVLVFWLYSSDFIVKYLYCIFILNYALNNSYLLNVEDGAHADR